MILYNLRCAADHEFEAWFKDSAAFDEQSAAGEVVCPVCGDASVAKAPMAPRIAKGGAKGAPPTDEGDESAPGRQTYTNSKAAEIRRTLIELRRHVEANSDYVGKQFAEEARKIHYGETEERSIYGEATEDQAQELTEEGIKIGRIPWLPRTDS